MKKGLKLNNKGKMKVHELNVAKGFKIMRRAKQLCPVDTGRLRTSITIVDSEGVISMPEASKDALFKPSGKYVVRVGTNVDYAEYVERGTDYMVAQPFLRPAYHEVLNS